MARLSLVSDSTSDSRFRALYWNLQNLQYALHTNQFQPHFNPLYLARNQRFQQPKTLWYHQFRLIEWTWDIWFHISDLAFVLVNWEYLKFSYIVKNQRYESQYWKMWPGIPNLIMVVGQFSPHLVAGEGYLHYVVSGSNPLKVKVNSEWVWDVVISH